jgi:hypothetical protein
MNEVTIKEIAQHYSSVMDSVNLRIMLAKTFKKFLKKI